MLRMGIGMVLVVRKEIHLALRKWQTYHLLLTFVVIFYFILFYILQLKYQATCHVSQETRSMIFLQHGFCSFYLLSGWTSIGVLIIHDLSDHVLYPAGWGRPLEHLGVFFLNFFSYRFWNRLFRQPQPPILLSFFVSFVIWFTCLKENAFWFLLLDLD